MLLDVISVQPKSDFSMVINPTTKLICASRGLALPAPT